MPNKSTKGRGRGWHGNPQGHADAGVKGGRRTYEEYGEEFYQQIGRAGGKKRSQNQRNRKAS